MTSWTSRTSPTTSWSGRTPIALYGSYLCDRLGNFILDVNGNNIVVFDTNGDIPLAGTAWTSRTIPS